MIIKSINLVRFSVLLARKKTLQLDKHIIYYINVLSSAIHTTTVNHDHAKEYQKSSLVRIILS